MSKTQSLTAWVRKYLAGHADADDGEITGAAEESGLFDHVNPKSVRVIAWKMRSERSTPETEETRKPSAGAPSLDAAVAAIAERVAREVARPIDPATIRAEVERAVAAQPAMCIEVKTPTALHDMGKAVLPEDFGEICQLAGQRINVLMVGPTGCGKTFVGQKLSEALGLDFASISCSVGMSESQLAGWLVPGKGGEFVYRESPFVRMYRDGGVFLFDELDSADPNTLTFIHAALANSHMYIPHMAENGGRVARHDDFVCIAAANTFGTGADAMYVGRNQLDEATLDRFRIGRIFMDYSPKVEKALIDPAVLKWGKSVRKTIQKHKMRRTCSMRALMDLTKMVKAHNWEEERWVKALCADWTEDERGRVSA